MGYGSPDSLKPDVLNNHDKCASFVAASHNLARLLVVGG